LNQSMFGIVMSAMGLGQTVALSPDLGKGAGAVQSIFSTLERKSKINPFSQDGQKPSTLLGDLKFEKIEFSYPTRNKVKILSNFDLTVPRGKTVAFVGTSGSGKSTLVLLLERFYDTDQGSVSIDGVNVRDLNVEWLRSQIGIVAQEPNLMRGTIMENIRAGKLDATDEEVYEAARSANAYDFIVSFPDTFQTVLETASSMSGGQKQRIAIARALIRKPKLLLFDEATSALDEGSQKTVQQSLDRLLEKSDRTTIVVAHRLSTIRSADIIVVLQSGVIVEQGSFASLSAKKDGAFSQLLQAQESNQ